MQKVSLLKLYFIFVKIGAILLGGGYVILPIMLSEFSEKRNLVSKEEIIDYFALSQSLPGIIAANISMFVGYKIAGKIGSILGMLGIITVPFLIIIILASILGALVGSCCYCFNFIDNSGNLAKFKKRFIFLFSINFSINTIIVF